MGHTRTLRCRGDGETRRENVSLTNVDGQSMFGNIVSQLENEKDAAALLKAALEGFPENCLEATVVGEPLLVQKDETKATLRFLSRRSRLVMNTWPGVQAVTTKMPSSE